MKTVLVLGATGYIGGEAFVRIYEQFPEFEYTTLVRTQENVTKMKQAGLKNVILDPDTTLQVVEREASGKDIVLHCADADDLGLMRTILRACKNTFERTGKRVVYIHTSGTGLVTEIGAGTGSLTEAARSKIYDDGKPEDIRAIDVNGPHRNVDLEILQAGVDGYVNAYILAPSTIYGTGRGPVRQISQQIPNIVRAMVKCNKGFYVGEGTNLWPGVHIRDLGDLYVLLLQKALSEDAVGMKQDPFERFYWGTNNEFSFGDVEKGVAELLVKKGRIADTKIESITFEELIKSNPMLRYLNQNLGRRIS